MEERQSFTYESRRIFQIPIERIVPNPRQPRRHFDQQALAELAQSIRQHGILQPLTVQREGRGYVLVAGERRLRAAGMAGLERVPCVVIRLSEEDSALLALVENLQRSDLHYLEEAAAIAQLISTFGISQEETARRLGRSQSAVANKLRLLRLSEPCCQLLRQYGLSERHARALLRLEGEDRRLAALGHIGERGLNVAQTEAYIESLLQERQRTGPGRRPVYIIKDVRLFLNSVTRSMDTIRRAGVDATYDQQESDDTITITIQIPKDPRKKSAGSVASNKTV